jgi:ATP-dependent Clp protease ATP-binding subunit ClpC
MANPYEWRDYGYAKSPFRLPTERAAQVVLNAAKEAARSGCPAVEPEHLLLALASVPDSIAGRILAQLGVGLDAVRASVEGMIVGDRAGAVEAQRLLSPGAKRVIDYAYDEARRLDNLFIGVEHLLLGLLREEEGIAWRVLSDLGVQLDAVRSAAHTMKWG